MAYLGDLEYNPENLKMLKKNGKSMKSYKIKEVEIDGSKKKFIKGGRLHLYPTDMRIYRKSKGIEEPKCFYGLYAGRENVIGSCKPYYKENIKILSDFYKPLNNIVYELYNKRQSKISRE